MSYIIAVAKNGYSALDEMNPNNFIFHSSYNTFKIIRTGVAVCTIVASTNGQLFYEPHRLKFTPLVTAFARESGYSQAFPPNTINISTWGPKAGLIGSGLKFVSVAADATNMIFKFDNSGGEKTAYVRYYCLEGIT